MQLAQAPSKRTQNPNTENEKEKEKASTVPLQLIINYPFRLENFMGKRESIERECDIHDADWYLQKSIQHALLALQVKGPASDVRAGAMDPSATGND